MEPRLGTAQNRNIMGTRQGTAKGSGKGGISNYIPNVSSGGTMRL